MLFRTKTQNMADITRFGYKYYFFVRIGCIIKSKSTAIHGNEAKNRSFRAVFNKISRKYPLKSIVKGNLMIKQLNKNTPDFAQKTGFHFKIDIKMVNNTNFFSCG